MNRLKSCGLGAAAVSLLLSANASAAPLAQQYGAFGIVTYDPEPKTGYEAWAEENSITGAWDEKDASGIHNVFRYVFGVESGAFTNPPLIDIAFEDGKVVIKTPPVVNSEGVTVSVVESSDVAGKTVTATKAVDAAGSTEFTKDSAAASRFYRLKAEATE